MTLKIEHSEKSPGVTSGCGVVKGSSSSWKKRAGGAARMVSGLAAFDRTLNEGRVFPTPASRPVNFTISGENVVVTLISKIGTFSAVGPAGRSFSS